MGKIFDALQKSDRTISGAARPTVKANLRHHVRRVSEKVVPLVNATPGLPASLLDRTLIAYHDPQSVEAELFKKLRTNILFPDSGLPPKTILITSALPDDGKSFVSANLAISIAQGVEEHVLLIDADIRKPDIHIRFGFKNVPGLSDYLYQGDNIAKVLLKTVLKKLTLLPAGKPPANPTELIASKKMKALLEEVKARYDDRYIIIDSPPPSMAPEINAIVQYVDGVILVVRAGKTPRAAVADTIEQIGKDKILGIVLNQADQSEKKYYGYNKSYYQSR
jgi:protein-tyrosine kinase